MSKSADYLSFIRLSLDYAHMSGGFVEPTFEFFSESICSPVAVCRILMNALEANSLEIIVNGGIQSGWGARSPMSDASERFRGMRGYKWRPSGEQFVQENTDAVDICGHGEQLWIACGLLG
jgi:hypothetical protein